MKMMRGVEALFTFVNNEFDKGGGQVTINTNTDIVLPVTVLPGSGVGE